MADQSCDTNDLTNKPGWQTTEFYVTLLTALTPLLAALFHRDFSSQVQVVAPAAAAVATAAYSFSRSQNKRMTMHAKAMVKSACAGKHSDDATASSSAATPASSAPLAAVPIDTLALILARLDVLSTEHAPTRRTKARTSS